MVALLVSVTLALLDLWPPAPPAPGDAAWQTVETVDGIVIKRAASSLGAPWGLGEAEIVAPLERVAAHLIDFDSLPRHVKRLAEARVLERRADEALVYFRLDLPWPVHDRDWVARYQWARDERGFRMVWHEENQRAPATKALRLPLSRGYWELGATERGTTFARYVFLAELGGKLPRSVLLETAARQPLHTLQGIRAVLAPPATKH